MLNVQLRGLFSLKKLLIINFSLLIFTSCSIQQKISRSAKQVINDSSLLTAHLGISIYDPESGKYWYNYQGDKYFVPASNTKIPTCYAAMKYLGDSLVGLRYFGEFKDRVVIQPTGDPTFLHPDFKIQRVYDSLQKVTDDIVLHMGISDFHALGNGWAWNDYNESYMAERSRMPIYGNIVRINGTFRNLNVIPKYFKNKVDYIEVDGEEILLSDTNIVLTKGQAKNSGHYNDSLYISSVHRAYGQNSYGVRGSKRPTGKIEVPFLASETGLLEALLKDTLKVKRVNRGSFYVEYDKKIYSQPTDSLLKPMMHRSDNFFAEQSLLMVSNERLGIMSDEKIIDTLLKTDFKDLPQRPRWADGSGLSRYNLFTPQDFVAILNKMKNEFGMERIKVIFPTGGTGTISNYYKADSNFIFAKTGTLSGVVALSGFLYTKKGKLLIFSTLVNNHQASSTAVRRAVEKFIQGIREKY